MKGLPIIVKNCVEKARDSAMLAVEVYNKPAVTFKTGGYVVMMIIAWTALFHAYFYKQGIKPIYRKSPKRYATIDGDYKYWELGTCLDEYFKDQNDPTRKNLEFFIKLRNKIEHRSMPEIDADVFGESQAMLLNFNDYLEKFFGKKHAIRASLSFALQMYPEPRGMMGSNVSQIKDAVDFIQSYRSALSASITNSGQYAFKAFLIQVGNHSSKNALPVQFVQYNALTDEQKEELGKFSVLHKDKIVPMVNMNSYKPTEVVKLVQQKLHEIGYKNVEALFKTNTHTNFWKRYKVRPNSASSRPEKTDTKYCVYDRAHRDYVYLQEWIDLIVKDLTSDKNRA